MQKVQNKHEIIFDNFLWKKESYWLITYPTQSFLILFNENGFFSQLCFIYFHGRKILVRKWIFRRRFCPRPLLRIIWVILTLNKEKIAFHIRIKKMIIEEMAIDNLFLSES